MMQNTYSWMTELREELASPAGNGIPLYLYFAGVFETFVAEKKIQPGSRLPVDRIFAEQIGISHITLARGLNELRKKGLIERSRAHGTFVSHALPEEKKTLSPAAVLFDDIVPERIGSTIFPALYNELSVRGYKMLFYSAAGDS
jgi:DNA-binding transcriptional regulator YhcF (GntR family)